jgi:hypothetical protein
MSAPAAAAMETSSTAMEAPAAETTVKTSAVKTAMKTSEATAPETRVPKSVKATIAKSAETAVAKCAAKKHAISRTRKTAEENTGARTEWAKRIAEDPDRACAEGIAKDAGGIDAETAGEDAHVRIRPESNPGSCPAKAA